MENLTKRTYTIAEVATVLGVGINSAYKIVNSKTFPKIRVGRKIVVPITAFEHWLEEQSYQ